MLNDGKYDNTFISTFKIETKDLEGLKYQDIPFWDSVGHMALMSKLEEVFDIELDVDDIIDFSSYEFGKEILAKYDIDVKTK